MGKQIELRFDAAPAQQLARRSDPATSKAAAVNIAPRLGTFKRKLWEMADGTPRTARELAELAVVKHGGEVETFRKRARELVREGFLVEAAVRACVHTGEKATTYHRPT